MALDSRWSRPSLSQHIELIEIDPGSICAASICSLDSVNTSPKLPSYHGCIQGWIFFPFRSQRWFNENWMEGRFRKHLEGRFRKGQGRARRAPDLRYFFSSDWHWPPPPLFSKYQQILDNDGKWLTIPMTIHPPLFKRYCLLNQQILDNDGQWWTMITNWL